MKAMTAYSYTREAAAGEAVEVSFKSLNSKYLDINIRHLPAENVLLERKIKSAIEDKISRGRVEMGIFIKSTKKDKAVINQNLLKTYCSQVKKIAKNLGLDPKLSMGELLSLPNLITVESTRSIDEHIILSAVRKTVDKAVLFREKEGRAIKKRLIQHLKRLEAAAENIAKVKPKVKSGDLGKEDIDEEVSLMQFYISKLEKMISRKQKKPVGKTIDFLAQEILRELNTCASKSKQKTLASHIIEAKNLTERIREQAQNVE